MGYGVMFSRHCPMCVARLLQLGVGQKGRWTEVNAYRCDEGPSGANRFRDEGGAMVPNEATPGNALAPVHRDDEIFA